MLASLRLAVNALAARRARTTLLVLAVAMSAALIVAVACALASATGAINHQLATTIGAAEVRLRPAGAGDALDRSLLDAARSWPGVEAAEPRVQSTLAASVRIPMLVRESSGSWARREQTLASTALANSLANSLAIDPGGGTAINGVTRSRRDRSTERILNPPPDLIAGRLPTGEDEIVVDALLALRLSPEIVEIRQTRDGFRLPGAIDARLFTQPSERREVPPVTMREDEARAINAGRRLRVGDEIEVVRQLVRQIDVPLAGLFERRQKLKVVGIAAQPPLGGRPQAYMTLAGLEKLSGTKGYSQIDIKVAPGVVPQELVDRHAGAVPRGVLLQTTERITSGLDTNVASSRLGMILAMVMGAIAGAFIIMTGLTTAVAQRQRELAILRCIGGTRAQLAWTQIFTGLLLGVLGALVGVPLGLAAALILTHIFSAQLPTGLVIEWPALALGAGCAILAGLLGAGYPAWQAARLSPLTAMRSSAAPTRPRHVAIVTGLALAGLAIQALVVGLPRDGQVIFWGYATLGLPLMFAGYFLLGVPTVMLVSRFASGLVSRLLRLPPRLLHRTVIATPYRHGLTAGAMMGGLALMVSLWTNGGAILRDWVGKIQFPDAFISGLNLSEDTHRQVRAMTDLVADTAAVTLHPVDVDSFGVRAIQRYKTTFIGFDPAPFFRMTRLTWVQGDPETALRKLEAGGAIIVAREFLTANGLGVGDTFTCSQDGVAHTFEIVGVVASPGLEIVSKFFNVGEDVTDQSLHAVFGSREDLKAKFFGARDAPIQMIQIQFTPRALENDEAALDKIRRELLSAGILDAGSGRVIKDTIRTFAIGGLVVVSAVGALGMLIASLGVANIIIAGIEARQFEFGVLRSIGASPGTLSRLVLGEAVLIALTACVLGTLLGFQGAWAGQKLHALLLGLSYHITPPIGPIAIGWGVLTLFTILASIPAVWRLSRKRPRELLGAMKG